MPHTLTRKNVRYLSNIAFGQHQDHVSNMGGARRRMRDTLGFEGYLVSTYRHGRIWYDNKLSPKGFDAVITERKRIGDLDDVEDLEARRDALQAVINQKEKADAVNKARRRSMNEARVLEANTEKVKRWRVMNHPDASDSDADILAYIERIVSLDLLT